MWLILWFRWYELLIFLFTNRVVPESVRWLLTHGKKDDAEKLLRQVAKVNKKKIPDEGLGLPEDQKSDHREAGFMDLFGTRAMTKKTVISLISWLALGYLPSINASLHSVTTNYFVIIITKRLDIHSNASTKTGKFSQSRIFLL